MDETQVKDSRWNRDYWLDVVTTVLLALTTIASAWSAYQSARWGGVQSIALTESNSTRTEAIGQSDRAYQLTTIDISLYVQYISAVTRHDMELADFLEHRFRPEMKTAFKAWLATDPFHNPHAPTSPFVMPDYKSEAREKALHLNKEADRLLETAKKANQQSDNYVMLTVLFASVLFFAGICTKPLRPSMQMALLIFGLILFFATLSILVTYPVH